MSKAKYFIPVIGISILSAIVVYPVLVYSDRLYAYSQSSFLQIILYLTPIIIAILLSLASGYIVSPSAIKDKFPFGAIFLLAIFVLAASTFFIFGMLVFIKFINLACEGENCGTGLEPLIPVVMVSPFVFIYALIFGLCTAFFYKVGRWIKNYKFGNSQ